MRINTNTITNWQIATKTRPIKAIKVSSLITDSSILPKLLINTLEGEEPVNENTYICVGEAGDVWQQMPDKLNKKYNVGVPDEKGWSVCVPKPENEVRCKEVSSGNTFSIISLFGKTVNGEEKVQTGESGDFICQNPADPKDVWIVKRSLFNNTYVIKS